MGSSSAAIPGSPVRDSIQVFISTSSYTGSPAVVFCPTIDLTLYSPMASATDVHTFSMCKECGSA